MGREGRDGRGGERCGVQKILKIDPELSSCEVARGHVTHCLHLLSDSIS